ncbi:hypothetical protein Tco_0521229, partial [Tanacetum coccineum]
LDRSSRSKRIEKQQEQSKQQQQHKQQLPDFAATAPLTSESLKNVNGLDVSIPVTDAGEILLPAETDAALDLQGTESTQL